MKKKGIPFADAVVQRAESTPIDERTYSLAGKTLDQHRDEMIVRSFAWMAIIEALFALAKNAYVAKDAVAADFVRAMTAMAQRRGMLAEDVAQVLEPVEVAALSKKQSKVALLRAPKVTTGMRRRMVAGLKEGMTLKQISAATGVSTKTVAEVLAEEGVRPKRVRKQPG